MREQSEKRRFSFKLDHAQAVALVQAVEEQDRAGKLLLLDEKQTATRIAREQVGKKADDSKRWLPLRADALREILKQREPRLKRILRACNVANGLALPVLLPCLALGLATSALGPEKRFNILAMPLLSLIVWNLLMMAFMLFRRFLPGWKAIERREQPPFLDFLQRHAERWVEKLPVKRHASEEDQEKHQLLQNALLDFLPRWLSATQKLSAARIRRLFHVGALALVVGVVAGMYLRGILFAYTASWESTFLKTGTVDAFLRFVLAPASWLSGLPTPRASLIQAPLQGPAEQWIHLFALTALLFVGVPRGLLILFESLRCASAKRKIEIDLPTAYVRRLAASAKGVSERVDVLPYSFTPKTASVEHLKSLLFDLFGSKADIRVLASAEYGAEKEDLALAESGRCVIVLFSLAQTPENEVHGELLQELQHDLPDGQALLAVLDDSIYKRRIEATTADGRLAQRRKAWERVVREAGLEPVVIDLAEPLPEETLNRLVEAAWPQGILADSK